ncbi:iron-sulfur cluster carrier protein ApbC [Alloalcanivorax mobilis]|uniref:iron-sulfur cluster carrier protein ApbC n=1 Tax=Alloalcanivorax mobilis TaxID=2019569 RepID=UPI000C75F0F4|nr:iron-sulfur cluster carrier protein ApbC [Alloalcanivorax mobilis]
MISLSREHVQHLLRLWREPYQQQDLVASRALKSVSVDNGRIGLNITLGFPADGYLRECSRALRDYLMTHSGATGVDIALDWKVRAHGVQGTLEPLPGIRNIIAVASGKGGVGKSTTSANLALALSAEGARVGILDADIYGPSQPRMMGVTGRPHSDDGKKMEPLQGHGIQIMSVGFLVDEDTPVIWRGSMVTKALTQLLRETRWRDLDYLIVDLPPGTGDIQLTLAQQIPVSGAVIVTTPQDLALLDARKALRMFEKVEIPVLGVIENMSTHVCSQCGHMEPIFGEGGGQRMAEDCQVELLGQLPLEMAIRAQADSGRPTVVAAPEGPAARLYRDLARRTAARLARRSLDHRERFPRIVVQNQ